MLVSEVKIREDDFSWQGTCDADNRFFIRRLKEPEKHVFSDVLFGDLDEEISTILLEEFIRQTGVLPRKQLVAMNISPTNSDKADVVRRYDAITNCLNAALKDCGYTPVKSRLIPNLERYDVLIEVE